MEAKYASSGLPMAIKSGAEVLPQEKLSGITVLRVSNTGAPFWDADVIPSQRQGFAKAYAGVQEKFEEKGELGVDVFSRSDNRESIWRREIVGHDTPFSALRTLHFYVDPRVVQNCRDRSVNAGIPRHWLGGRM